FFVAGGVWCGRGVGGGVTGGRGAAPRVGGEGRRRPAPARARAARRPGRPPPRAGRRARRGRGGWARAARAGGRARGAARVWAPDKLRKQLAAIRATPNARWSAVGHIRVDENLTRGWEMHPPPSGDIAAAILERNVIPAGGSGVLAETALLRSCGPFDEQLHA